MLFRNKIFIIIFLFCSILLSAQTLELAEKAHPMARFGLNTEQPTSPKIRAADSLDCTLVGGWFRGPSFAVYVVDTLAYMGAGQSIKILNVKDSTNPVLLGEVLLPSIYIMDIFVKDTFAYVANYEEDLRIINVSDPSSPTEIGFCETPGFARTLWIQDSFAYIADHYGNPSANRGLRIIDVSNPSSPTIIGSYNEPWGYNYEDVWVEDTIAYLAGKGLRIINVSDPSSPDSISVYSDTLYFYGVYVQDTLVYVTGYTNSMEQILNVINVVDPSSPIEVGSYYLNIPIPYGMFGNIYVQDSLAYVAAFSMVGDPDIDSCGLYIVNVSNPASMNEVGNYLTGSGRAWDICVKDNLAYVSCYSGFSDDPEGLLIIDVSEPSSPAEIGEYDTHSWIDGVWVKDSFAYLANAGRGLNIINVSNPTAPFETGFCETPVYPREVFAKDTFAYVAGDSGLSIINVANPFSPIGVGFCNKKYEYGSYSVCVQDTFAYVAEHDSGLRIINVSDPSLPEEIGYFNPGWVGDVWVRDTLAYLAAGSLYVIDISDPSLPMEIGSTPTGGYEKIFVKDTFAYAGGGLHTIDVSDPSSPSEVGFCSLPGPDNEGIFVQGNLAYVAMDEGGLRIVDVTDPSSPNDTAFYLLDEYETHATDVYVKDTLIYVADGRFGLYIFKYTGPVAGIEESSTVENSFNISNISNTIEINYSIATEKEKVKIEIFNILGQKVDCPINGIKERGNYTLNWNGKTGIYFVSMELGGKVYKQKALLLR